MSQAPTNTRVIDVEYLGRRQYIACALLEGNEPAIVDPGPAVSLSTLEAGLAAAGLTIEELSAVLLTHVHLDHAGATGTIVRRNPGVRVYVHRRGAPHMAAPGRLLRSAERLYGDRMDELWGAFLAVPEANLVALDGGETLRLADRTLEVADIPGHASHHVGYLDCSDGTAFVGDTAGIRIDGCPYVLPVTPPPDIDLEAWELSLQTIEAWRPGRLFVTHFGVAPDVDEHLQQFRRRLHHWATSVREGLAGSDDHAQLAATFTKKVSAELEVELDTAVRRLYRQGGAPDMSWHGLARYWTKASEASA